MSATAITLRKALTTASNSGSFTAKEPTATAPSGDGVWDLLSSAVGWGGGVSVPSYLKIIPYAVGAGSNDTFDMRVWGWNETNDATKLYIPQTLFEASITLGAYVGGVEAIGTNVQMAKTITVVVGAADGPFRVLVSTAADLTPSHVLLHTQGCRYIEFDFDSTDAQASGMNCYIRPMEP